LCYSGGEKWLNVQVVRLKLIKSVLNAEIVQSVVIAKKISN
jgi:hypothetical protein